MSTSTQLLKAYGHLPDVEMSDLGKSSAMTAASLVDSDILAGRVCGHPDYADEELANSDVQLMAGNLGMVLDEAEQLKQCHKRMWAAAGSGSFPPGCHTDLYPYPMRHAVTYYIRRGTFGDNYTRGATEAEVLHVHRAGVWPWSKEWMRDSWVGKPILDVGLQIVQEAYRRTGFWLMEVTSEPKADIILLSRFIQGSTIGIGWFNDGTCTDVVESHYDSSWQPALFKLSLLLLHEIGHNLNLRHQFSNQQRHRGVMSYNWPSNVYGFLKGDENILPRDPSWHALTEFTGGEPIPSDLPDRPEPPVVGAPAVEDIHIRIADSTYVYEVRLKGSDDDDIPIGV